MNFRQYDYDKKGVYSAMRILYWLLSVLVIAGLVGVAAGIAYGSIVITGSCIVGITIFMWLGFFIKARQQRMESKENS